MEFRLLGPVEVWSSGRRLWSGEPRQRAVLAALLVDAGRTVPVETLVDRVWGDSPPRQARRTLNAHVSRVRRLIAGTGPDEGVRLIAGDGGYAVTAGPDQVDLLRFRALVERAGLAGQPEPARAEQLQRALALWRGEPLAGLAGDWAERLRRSWAQERLSATVSWARAELASGRPGVVLAQLTELADEHPMAETVVVVLMQALCANGRTAEALDRYAVTQARLRTELGADPGPELAALHRAILRDELAPPAVRAAPGPAQLPADVASFVGRAEELAVLDRLSSDGPMVISAVSGTAGVGKTALALHWAHRVLDRFPDGQLYVDLRGYDPGLPVDPGDALAGFLAALGVIGADLPVDRDARASRYRTAVSGRRMLVVLDNAATVEQVRPLLPGTPGCAVLVTSRDSLAGLVALHGARRLTLDVLPAEQAVGLLGELIGDRVAAEPGAAVDLAERCARLPLALRVAAELTAGSPDTALSEVVADLADEQQRIALLAAGDDPRAAVSAVFSWSLRRLDAASARTFRLLGLHPGPDFDAGAAAALAGHTAAETRRVLDRLARAHLIEPAGAGRFRMHDLLRAYAAGLVVDEDEREGARAGLLDHYLAAVTTAIDALYPAEAEHRPRLHAPVGTVEGLSGAQAARAWLAVEMPCLTRLAAYCAATGRATQAVQLAVTLRRHLLGGHYAPALEIYQHALTAAREAPDLIAEAHALAGLGAIHISLGDPGTGIVHCARANDLFRRAGDRAGEARTQLSLGVAHERLGRLSEAAEHCERAQALFRDSGDITGESGALSNLGIIEERLGRYDAAVLHQRRALVLCRRLNNRTGEAYVRTALGDVEERRGNPRAAIEHQRVALSLFRELDNRSGMAGAHNGLGVAYTRLGRPGPAAEQHRQALALYAEIGDRDGECWSLNGLGEAALADGNPAAALDAHHAALQIADRLEIPDQRDRAHAGLSRAAQRRGTPGPAAALPQTG